MLIPAPRKSDVRPTPRSVVSQIRPIVGIRRVVSVARTQPDAIGAAGRRAVRPKGIECHNCIGHEETTLWPDNVPAVVVNDGGPGGLEHLRCVGAGRQERNCSCHEAHQKYPHGAFPSLVQSQQSPLYTISWRRVYNDAVRWLPRTSFSHSNSVVASPDPGLRTVHRDGAAPEPIRSTPSHHRFQATKPACLCADARS